MVNDNCSAALAKEKLIEGNKKYLQERSANIKADEETLLNFAENGQKPYAIIVTCADSRVVPEAIFSAGLGDLFVIRVAGNVIDSNQLGSIEYAADHLGSNLVVVLGHSRCGAVDAAINHKPTGYVKYITDEISKAIGSEKDALKACCLNVRHSCDVIEKSLLAKEGEEKSSLEVYGAVYHIETGKVEFLQ